MRITIRVNNQKYYMDEKDYLQYKYWLNLLEKRFVKTCRKSWDLLSKL